MQISLAKPGGVHISGASRETTWVSLCFIFIAINAAFDNLFETVQTKETDVGVAMFNAKSGSWGNSIDAAALEATISRVIAGSPSHFSRDTVVTAPLFTDLPSVILAAAKKEGYDNNGRKHSSEKLTGATYDGKVYLVQENVSSELEAEETPLHERIHQIVHGNANFHAEGWSAPLMMKHPK